MTPIIPGVVPCNGCRLCCFNTAVVMLPGDDASSYQTEPHSDGSGRLILAHRVDGSCVYLGAAGCTIHDRRPRMCRSVDCRIFALSVTPEKAREMDRNGVVPFSFWKRGAELAEHSFSPASFVHH